MEKFCGEKILIIGGGASGMFCALKLAAHGKSGTILELSDRLGKKLLATGNCCRLQFAVGWRRDWQVFSKAYNRRICLVGAFDKSR